MVGNPTLLFIEDILQLLGGIIGLTIGYIALNGYKETGSRSLLRLSAAFFFLSIGFFFSGIAGFTGSGFLQPLASAIALFIIPAAVFETTGYFFLAFSHALDVRAGRKHMRQILFIPLFTVNAALKSLSLYFLIYGVTETIISYIKSRRIMTMVISIGLSFLAFGEFIRWISLLYPQGDVLMLFSLVLRICGLTILFIPVVRFSFMEVQIGGAL